MNRNYELVVILDPEVKAEEQEKLLAKIKKQITDSDGKASPVQEMGKKELAYPIKKRNAGNFYLVQFSAPAAAVSSLRQKMLLEERILRYLLIAKGEEEGEKKAKA